MKSKTIITKHDPREFVRGLQQILISDSKRIGFLFGAGTSMSSKRGRSKDSVIPGVKEMTKIVVDKIGQDNFKKALKQIEEELSATDMGFQIEYILSCIIQKEQVVGKETLCGLKKEEFEALRKYIEKEIIEVVSVHKKRELFIKDLLHCDFALWVSHAARKNPVELFTSNYDYLFELALEYHNVNYFDGFVGSFEPFFSPSLVEDLKALPQYQKLWKLHGSLGWAYDDKNKKIIRRDQRENSIIVFPNFLKYDNSKKQPYVSFIDRLIKFVSSDDSVLIVCGYSFSDQHINEAILTALEKAKASHVIGLYYDDIRQDSPVAELAKKQPKLSVYGRRNAVIGGKYGNWKLKTEPSKDDSIVIDLYFDEDAALPIGGSSSDHIWTGEGTFKLPDFEHFVTFLSAQAYEQTGGAAR
ncbi:hypothetical protein BMS3Abin06_00814 [bacterium BMS3Abin06]|nr:hypothetical protein BMS3Abin06_00814 [bacterium BMS3Abin06]HDZ01527.1 hypothetical protein [Nitrospirota bacterium]